MAETYIELGVSEQKNAQTLSRNKMQYEDSATTTLSVLERVSVPRLVNGLLILVDWDNSFFFLFFFFFKF